MVEIEVIHSLGFNDKLYPQELTGSVHPDTN